MVSDSHMSKRGSRHGKHTPTSVRRRKKQVVGMGSGAITLKAHAYNWLLPQNTKKIINLAQCDVQYVSFGYCLSSGNGT